MKSAIMFCNRIWLQYIPKDPVSRNFKKRIGRKKEADVFIEGSWKTAASFFVSVFTTDEAAQRSLLNDRNRIRYK